MTRFSRSFPVAFALVLFALPAVLEAQGNSRPTAPVVPANMMPPVGMCRIWVENVAPAQQPAPTDCQTAIRQRPTNGTVIFGPTPNQEDSPKFEPRGTERADTARAAKKAAPRDSSRAQKAAPRRPSSEEPRAPEQP